MALNFFYHGIVTGEKMLNTLQVLIYLSLLHIPPSILDPSLNLSLIFNEPLPDMDVLLGNRMGYLPLVPNVTFEKC